MPFDPNPIRTIGAAENLLIERGSVEPGDHLVIVSDLLAGEDRFDSIQLRRVPEQSG
jgi:pyruvate kinase